MRSPAEVLDGPVRKHGLIVRLVATPDGGAQCQLWHLGRWVRGGCLGDLWEAPWLRRAEMQRYGIRSGLAPNHPDK